MSDGEDRRRTRPHLLRLISSSWVGRLAALAQHQYEEFNLFVYHVPFTAFLDEEERQSDRAREGRRKRERNAEEGFMSQWLTLTPPLPSSQVDEAALMEEYLERMWLERNAVLGPLPSSDAAIALMRLVVQERP